MWFSSFTFLPYFAPEVCISLLTQLTGWRTRPFLFSSISAHYSWSMCSRGWLLPQHSKPAASHNYSSSAKAFATPHCRTAMKRISCSQWQTRDVLAKALSKDNHVLCCMGWALIIWKQNWTESHRHSNYRETEQDRRKPGCESKEESRQRQRCCSSRERAASQSLQTPLLQHSCSASLPHCSDSLQSHWFKQQQTQLCSSSSWASEGLADLLIRDLCALWDNRSKMRPSEDLTHSLQIKFPPRSLADPPPPTRLSAWIQPLCNRWAGAEEWK